MVSTRTISLKRVLTSIMRLERIKLEEEKDGKNVLGKLKEIQLIYPKAKLPALGTGFSKEDSK